MSNVVHPFRGVRPFQRHSLVLLVAGLVYIAVGGAYAFGELTPSRAIALEYATALIPFQTWGWVFIISGALTIISSRWPPISETWGYTILTGLSAGWGTFYGVGVLFGDSPPINLTGTLTWGLMAFMWWAISGLLNPVAFTVLRSQVKLLQAENLALHQELVRDLTRSRFTED